MYYGIEPYPLDHESNMPTCTLIHKYTYTYHLYSINYIYIYVILDYIYYIIGSIV